MMNKFFIMMGFLLSLNAYAYEGTICGLKVNTKKFFRFGADLSGLPGAQVVTAPEFADFYSKASENPHSITKMCQVNQYLVAFNWIRAGAFENGSLEIVALPLDQALDSFKVHSIQ